MDDLTNVLLALIVVVLGSVGGLIIFILQGHKEWMHTLTVDLKEITKEIFKHIGNETIHKKD